MSVRSARPLVVAALAAVLLAAAPAAQARTGDDGGWQPYRSAPEDFPAGALCPFHLYIGILVEGEETKVAARYPDGSPAKVLWRGPLELRYTNLDTGRSVDRDQSGKATLYHLPDGSKLWLIPRTSHISAQVHAGNPYHAPGDFLFSGGVTLLVHPDGQPQVLEQHQVENLCETLA
ncbi:hypothetical protein KV557_11170 [Kitasatospora aureofaciens]|uniref:hypothetical protein n=1 Tax=Kitasatospora aureofaciens TaxID=1894 RepID=UPI001C48A41A|nr:hypothetical protein [Kitasatospora aureofaciens]MBV6697685.1 hypothetical protein [Kitasatospora aureofaciens]